MTVARVVMLGAVALLTANCSSSVVSRGKSGNKYGVAASPKVIPDGMPVPKGGGRAMVGKPYVVGERTYVPQPGTGYVREGEASWYGTAFHGRLTANGEIFDKESVAAAHPTLPLPSYVRVTNVANRRSMIVRVNDRGPYERGRLIDLSERAAQALDFHRAGTTKVRVEYVGKASLGGSDDRKLLATLRTDGVPASTSRGPVMLAGLDERDTGRSNRSLSFKPLEDKEPEPAAVPVAAEPSEEAAPAPIIMASRSAGPVTRLAELEPPPPEPVAPRLPPVQARLGGSYNREAVRAPAPVAGALPKSDRVLGVNPITIAAKSDRLDAMRPAGKVPPTRPDRPLDLATIPGAARPIPIGPQRPLDLNPARSAQLRPDEARRPAGKDQAVLAKSDRKRVVDAETGTSRNAAYR